MSNRVRAVSAMAVMSFLVACGGSSDTTTPVTVGPVTTVTVTGQTATWASSDQTVATVNASGLVSGVKLGTATITATVSGISGSTALSVAAAPQTATVQATLSQTFSPKQVDILAGGSVTWQFSTLTHNVTFTSSANGTPQNIPDATSTNVSRSFTTAGTFTYQCTIHPGMTGTVVVH